MNPLVYTRSPKYSTIYSSYGWISNFGILIFLKVIQYRISTELPWSTKTLVMVNLSISSVITMGSSWAESIAVKSSSMNVIQGILSRLLVDTKWTDRTTQKCFFRVELEHSPPTKPSAIIFTSHPVLSNGIRPAIVLITSWAPRLVQSFFLRPSLRGRVLRTRLSLLLLCFAGRWLSSKRHEPSHPHQSYCSLRLLSR